MLNPLNILSKFIKSGNQRELDKLQNIVNEVNKLEENISKRSKLVSKASPELPAFGDRSISSSQSWEACTGS